MARRSFPSGGDFPIPRPETPDLRFNLSLMFSPR